MTADVEEDHGVFRVGFAEEQGQVPELLGGDHGGGYAFEDYLFHIRTSVSKMAVFHCVIPVSGGAPGVRGRFFPFSSAALSDIYHFSTTVLPKNAKYATI